MGQGTCACSVLAQKCGCYSWVGMKVVWEGKQTLQKRSMRRNSGAASHHRQMFHHSQESGATTQRVCHRSQHPHCSFLSPCFYHEHTPWHSRAGVPQHPSAPQPARWWAGQGAERTGLWASTLSSSYDIRLLSAVFITNPKQSATGATRK